MIQVLGNLPAIKRLFIWHGTINEADLDAICELRMLQTLSLNGPIRNSPIDALPPGAAQQFSRLPKLEILELHGQCFDERTLAGLHTSTR